MIIINGFRGVSRSAATSKMERFVIIVNGFQPLTIITKPSILDVAAALDPPLVFRLRCLNTPLCGSIFMLDYSSAIRTYYLPI